MPEDELALPQPDHSRLLLKSALFAGKLIVTAACFWLILHQIDVGEIARTLPTFDMRWSALAVLSCMAQIPLLALRFWSIVRALAPLPKWLTYGAANAITMIYALFAQLLPTVAGDGVRVWLLTQFGYGWRTGLTAVAIDRAAGVSTLAAFAFVVLQLPSALTALAGYRSVVLSALAVMLIGSGLALVFTPRIAPLLQAWKITRWLGILAADAHRILFGRRGAEILAVACFVHILTIVTIWALGHAQGLSLSAIECAVLFAIMLGMALVPISIGGWGLRELAVVSLLSAHGVASGRALLFSLSFGLLFVLSALPGALLLLIYPLGGGQVPRSTKSLACIFKNRVSMPGRASFL